MPILMLSTVMMLLGHNNSAINYTIKHNIMKKSLEVKIPELSLHNENVVMYNHTVAP